ncbi:hypothetical protein DPMN_062372 [Dreissena polymorpha]|uniref:Uncharacterized protein n=1 Tax=Dreissena polymorpha TaxID=45954 RepID=A0A9D4C9M4_DREPO|nr:hypothetical protein DPMN_062372 [Dreissena polymorpha]
MAAVAINLIFTLLQCHPSKNSNTKQLFFIPAPVTRQPEHYGPAAPHGAHYVQQRHVTRPTLSHWSVVAKRLLRTVQTRTFDLLGW